MIFRPDEYDEELKRFQNDRGSNTGNSTSIRNSFNSYRQTTSGTVGRHVSRSSRSPTPVKGSNHESRVSAALRTEVVSTGYGDTRDNKYRDIDYIKNQHRNYTGDVLSSPSSTSTSSTVTHSKRYKPQTQAISPPREVVGYEENKHNHHSNNSHLTTGDLRDSLNRKQSSRYQNNSRSNTSGSDNTHSDYLNA